MIGPGVRPTRHGMRAVTVLVVASAMLFLAACSSGTDTSSSPTPGIATSGTQPSGRTPSSTVPSSSPTATGAVPGRCTENSCPSLPVPTSQLMAGHITKANAPQKVSGYLSSVLDDLDGTWGPWFEKLGWGNPEPGRVLVEDGRSFHSACKDSDGPIVVASDTPNAFFCGLDKGRDGAGQRVEGSVILPVDAFVGIWTGTFLVAGPLDSISGFQGEFTAATVVAHEYGHAVVDRILQAGHLPATSEPTGENAELIADCLAGNWAATVLRRDELSVKDIVQAVALIQKIGDPEPGQGHGTSTQRISAITLGFFGHSLTQGQGQGQPIGCLSKYWPEVFGS
ncbi:neutral zinc metallopeptidase [Gordonia sp. DT30]|uniref:neutral zinc metallopeptidase n=1 Tax=unclassified Gordonia (in: high G+C Gram-positive bacteria) TaxID=2657482 RepID=UPI003CF2F35C